MSYFANKCYGCFYNLGHIGTMSPDAIVKCKLNYKVTVSEACSEFKPDSSDCFQCFYREGLSYCSKYDISHPFINDKFPGYNGYCDGFAYKDTDQSLSKEDNESFIETSEIDDFGSKEQDIFVQNFSFSQTSEFIDIQPKDTIYDFNSKEKDIFVQNFSFNQKDESIAIQCKNETIKVISLLDKKISHIGLLLNIINFLEIKDFYKDNILLSSYKDVCIINTSTNKANKITNKDESYTSIKNIKIIKNNQYAILNTSDYRAIPTSIWTYLKVYNFEGKEIKSQKADSTFSMFTSNNKVILTEINDPSTIINVDTNKVKEFNIGYCFEENDGTMLFDNERYCIRIAIGDQFKYYITCYNLMNSQDIQAPIMWKNEASWLSSFEPLGYCELDKSFYIISKKSGKITSLNINNGNIINSYKLQNNIAKIEMSYSGKYIAWTLETGEFSYISYPFKKVKYKLKNKKNDNKIILNNDSIPTIEDVKNLYKKMTLLFENKKYEEAIKCGNEGIEIIENQHKYKIYPDKSYYLTSFYHSLGLLYYELKKLDLSLKFYTKAKDIIVPCYIDDPYNLDLIQIYNNLASISEELDDFESALKFYNKSKAILEKIYINNPNDSDLDTIYNNIGDIYRKLGDFGLALEFYLKSKKILETMQTDKVDNTNLASLYNNIANVYSSLKNFKLSLQFYLKSKDLAEEFYFNDKYNRGCKINCVNPPLI